MGIKKHFNLRYMAVMLTFLAFSGTASGIFFLASSDKYADQRTSEEAVETTVEEVTFGYTPEGAHLKTDKVSPGEFCYITVEDFPEALRYPGLACSLEADDEVTIFVDENGEARLALEYMDLAKNALTAYTYFGFILGIGAAVGALFAWRKIKRNKLDTEEL